MSENDSFIDEVTEEVRRDQLFALFRKYGWIGVVAIMLIVGGAAWVEWTKARAEARAQAFGDAVGVALAPSDPATRLAALEKVDSDGDSGRALVLALLTSAIAETAGDKEKALASLKTVSDNGGLPMTYRQLALLKTVMLAGDTMPPADRDAILAQLTAPGNPYRSLALEQEALAQLGGGNTDAAIKILSDLRNDAEASGATQARADQLLTALGQPQPASN